MIPGINHPQMHPALPGVMGAIHNVSPHAMDPHMLGALNDFLHAHSAMGPRQAPQMNPAGPMGRPNPAMGNLAALLAARGPIGR